MNSMAHVLSPAPSAGVLGALQRIVAGAHWLRIAYAEQRRAARMRAELARLGEDALRDLGIARAELLSFDAEARGVAARTRLRVLDARGACRSA